jgi:hypothetical protein
MKRLAPLILLLPFAQCKKEKYCYICNTFREREYAVGGLVKDTMKAQVCEDQDFIEAYKKNGTFNGSHYELKDGDTVRFHLSMSTICTRK